MARIGKAGKFTLGNRTVMRVGYGAMQLAGPGVFGPPRNPEAALAVLREAVARRYAGLHFGWSRNVRWRCGQRLAEQRFAAELAAIDRRALVRLRSDGEKSR